MGSSLNEMREEAAQVSVGRNFQADGTASAKALRQKCDTDGTASIDQGSGHSMRCP